MHILTLMICLGLVDWLTTTILVESELFRPLRGWVNDRAVFARNQVIDFRSLIVEIGWRKARYLVGCHLCAGTWIGLALAAAVPSARPFGTGLVGWLLAGLLVKAFGHLTLVAHKAGDAVASLRWVDDVEEPVPDRQEPAQGREHAGGGVPGRDVAVPAGRGDLTLEVGASS